MFTVVRTPAEWEAYKVKIATGVNVLLTEVDWGRPPAAYPCLAVTLFPPRAAGMKPTAYTCFCYQADAAELLAACGTPAPAADPDAPKLPTQANFNRWVQAHLLTLAYFTVESGLCQQHAFEDKLVEMLEKVDRWNSADRAALKATLDRYQTTVLDSFDGRK